jgi:hypothetical protein
MTQDPNHVVTLIALTTISVVSIFGFLFLLSQLLSHLTHLRVQSLSFEDLWVLARSADDRASVIKEFYDWQHKLLIAVLTGLATVIATEFVRH